MNTKMQPNATMILNDVSFYNMTDWYDYFKIAACYNDVIYWRGIEYTIDNSLATGEIYSRKEVIGGSTYYYV